ncbi:MAG: phosphoribosylanthranilate isomerase [Bacillota bacterium]|nr:phosphoribosylanthranilate isomerase [Bacillota bacterium]
MTRIKLCGITQQREIEAINSLHPDYIGFVFAKKSKRYIDPEKAFLLKQKLDRNIQAVGVFVNEPIEQVAKLLENGTIDVAQLHGTEDETYIKKLRKQTNKMLIKAFQIQMETDISEIENCSADYVLIDSGAGSGKTFNWDIVKQVKRPFFLAGGLHEKNVETAIKSVHPYAVDVSSGIDTDGKKDIGKMQCFVENVRKGSEEDDE